MLSNREDFPYLPASAQQIARRAEETIHDLAQPLTLLQGSLELALAADNIENYRLTCRTVFALVQRITERFATARTMVHCLCREPEGRPK